MSASGEKAEAGMAKVPFIGAYIAFSKMHSRQSIPLRLQVGQIDCLHNRMCALGVSMAFAVVGQRLRAALALPSLHLSLLTSFPLRCVLLVFVFVSINLPLSTLPLHRPLHRAGVATTSEVVHRERETYTSVAIALCCLRDRRGRFRPRAGR